MLNYRFQKSSAAVLVICMAALLVILSVWPARLYHEDLFFSTGGSVEQVSEPVDALHDAGEYFTAQYNHLQTLEIWVDSVEYGNSLKFQLFLQNDNNIMALVAQELVEFPDVLPGYVSIPVDAEMIPGRTYVYTLRSPQGGEEIFRDGHWAAQPDSSFRIGFESAENAAANPQAPQYQVGFYNDTSLSGLAAMTRLTYRVPLGRKKSAAAVGAAVLAAILLSAAAIGIGHRYQKRNTQITLLQLLRRVLTPVVLMLGTAGFIMVWPMKLFDSRPLDVGMYLAGVILAAAWALYGLWHGREAEAYGNAEEGWYDLSVRRESFIGSGNSGAVKVLFMLPRGYSFRKRNIMTQVRRYTSSAEKTENVTTWSSSPVIANPREIGSRKMIEI